MTSVIARSACVASFCSTMRVIAPLFAHDAAVAGRVVHVHRQDRQLVDAGGGDQALQRRGIGQRHVAVQHQRRHRVVQMRRGLRHRVAGAELRLLAGETSGRVLPAGPGTCSPP